MLQQQGSAVVNGQLVSQVPAVSQFVTGFMPYSALGAAAPLSIPPGMGLGGVSGSTLQAGAGVTGVANPQAVANAAASPFDPHTSPVPWALGGLALALIALHTLHFRTD